MLIVVDAHVHIYDSCDLTLLFNSAYSNFSTFVDRSERAKPFVGVLLLAEKNNQNWFETTKAFLSSEGSITYGDWSLAKTTDQCCIKLSGINGEILYVVAGRQFNSSEGLEVLSLASKYKNEDTLDLQNLVSNIVQQGGVAVVPWAFGKWFGNRGKKLNHFLFDRPQIPFYLGDNGGRPIFMKSAILAENNNDPRFPVLPGSDPLPLENDEKRVGSYGFCCNHEFLSDNVSDLIKDLIGNSEITKRVFGKRVGWAQFMKNQFLLRKK